MIIIKIIIRIYGNDDNIYIYKLPTINFAKVSQFFFKAFIKILMTHK